MGNLLAQSVDIPSMVQVGIGQCQQFYRVHVHHVS